MLDKLDMTSPDLVNQNIEKIAALFPNCVTESANGLAIDFDMLKQELSKDIVEGNKERYRLEWPGKREAIVTANLPINKTLRPCREESVDFDNTENLYIEGDNLEVLKLLQESYLGKIKMIYIDPPYNTGKDFVYKDNFTQDNEEYLEESGFLDEYNNRLVVNPETSGRYHSDWLTMIYPRLKICRNLLSDEGVVFISIGPDEISNLISLSNEVFGEHNRAGICVRQAKSGGNTGKFFSPNVEYILVYAKDISKLNGFKIEMDEELIKKVYTQIEFSGEKKGQKYRTMGLYQASLKDLRPNQKYFIECPDGSKVLPPCSIQDEIMRIGDGRWRWTKTKFLEELSKGNVLFKETRNGILVDSNGEVSKWNIYTKIWLNDRQEEGQVPNDLILKYENRHSSKELQELNIPFDFAKPKDLISYLIKIAGVKSDEIVLDFFSGSGTTAHSLLQLNSEDGFKRKFIMAQIPELTNSINGVSDNEFKTICEIGKERIRRAGNAIIENQKALIKQKQNAIKINEEKNDLIKDEEKIEELKSEIEALQFSIENLDKGFRVYKLDSSNLQDVYYTPKDMTQELLLALEDNIKTDRTADDLVAQIMLDWGLPLSLKIEQTKIANKEVFKIADNALLCCFDEGIDEAFAKEIAKLKPLRIVFRDKSFLDDTAKENVKQLLKQLSPDSEMKVI